MSASGEGRSWPWAGWPTPKPSVSSTPEARFIEHERSSGTSPMWWRPSQDEPGPPTMLNSIQETIEIGERTGATVVATPSGVELCGMPSNTPSPCGWPRSAAEVRLIRYPLYGRHTSLLSELLGRTLQERIKMVTK